MTTFHGFATEWPVPATTGTGTFHADSAPVGGIHRTGFYIRGRLVMTCDYESKTLAESAGKEWRDE